LAGFWEGLTIHILILGGTRFTGRATVESLVEHGHEVTVISRNSNVPENVFSSVISDRVDGLKKIKGKTFDATIDFICSGEQDVEDVYQNIHPGLYVLISTVWLAKREGDKSKFPSLSEITERYLNAKKNAEQAVAYKRQQGYTATSLRLPIQSGVNDHTRRLLFYLDRIADKSGLILVNGGVNRFQIVNNVDVALALTKALSSNILASSAVWDAMPDSDITIKHLIGAMAGKDHIHTYDISSDRLAELLPEYLEQEPFWQEYPLKRLDHNLFHASGVVPREIEEWVPALWELTGSLKDSALRCKELAIIDDLKKNMTE